MELSVGLVEGVLVISVSGSIDALTGQEFADFLDAQVEQRQKHLVLDLGGVDFMGSAGLRAVMHLLRECRRRGGDLCLAAAQPGVARTLELSGLLGLVQAFSGVEEAVDSFRV